MDNPGWIPRETVKNSCKTSAQSPNSLDTNPKGGNRPLRIFLAYVKNSIFNTKIEFSRPTQFLNNNTANLTKFAGAHEGPVPHLLEKLMENANLTKFAGAH